MCDRISAICSIVARALESFKTTRVKSVVADFPYLMGLLWQRIRKDLYVFALCFSGKLDKVVR